MRSNSRPRRRRGLTIIEVAASALLLGTALTVTGSVIRTAVAQHRGAQNKRCAIEAASFILDRVSTLSWDAVTPKTARALRLSPPASESLANSQLRVDVDEERQPLAAKRITVRVSWWDRAGAAEQKVQLVTWIYRRDQSK